jgi:hypothetical protein
MRVLEMTQAGYVSWFGFPIHSPRTLITSGFSGTLGAGFPTALGVKVAMPDRPVVALTGDGGFLFGGAELATAVQFGINLVTVLFNNGSYGNVLRDQRRLFEGRDSGSKLRNPDFQIYAKSFGVPSWRANDADGLRGALREALAANSPALIEVMTDITQEYAPWGSLRQAAADGRNNNEIRHVLRAPLPQPWGEDSERRLYQEALAQVELGDKLGIDYVWEVEHHFLEEYSHSSAPEIFLAACSQRTQRIRLGHGIVLMPPKYNHPARVAERIATLDLVSNGRADWGTGESATALEMEGFNLPPEEKSAMWLEATEQAANMLAMRPYPGFRGKYFDMPCRNLVPKSVQKPHPPMWVACSKRETIHRRVPDWVLTFAFASLNSRRNGCRNTTTSSSRRNACRSATASIRTSRWSPGCRATPTSRRRSAAASMVSASSAIRSVTSRSSANISRASPTCGSSSWR